MFIIRRSPHNPLIQPQKTHPWEAMATFNWSPVRHKLRTVALYRAMSLPEPLGAAKISTSTIGLTTSLDGTHFTKRRQFIFPQEPWEAYGCEDPRVTKFEGKYYIFYTALGGYPFGPDNIKVAVAVTKNFSTIESKHLVTPFNAKAFALFPERVNGKLAALLTVHTDRPPAAIAYVEFDSPEQMWSEEFWNEWYANWEDQKLEDPRRSEEDHVEIGAIPILVKIPSPFQGEGEGEGKAWLLVYSHIQNYFSEEKIFGIEALLLDKEDPKKIIARTKGPMFVPEELYERYGHLNNIVFPSGALVRGQNLEIYYGATDTTCCQASVNLNHLLSSLHPTVDPSPIIKSKDPIISPIKDHPWEAKATFNPAAIDLAGKVHILYRAMGTDNTSVVGYATSTDGLTIDYRAEAPIYEPRAPFEVKAQPGNSGCEDARIVKVGDRLYMTYTAFDAATEPRVAVTSIAEQDFISNNWNWSEPILISPPGVMDKNTCLMPEPVQGRYMLLHRIGTDICADFIDTLDFTQEKISKCVQILQPRPGMWDSVKVGISAPPLLTKKGWLLLYHGVSNEQERKYRVGAALLDRKNPTLVLARTADFLLEPEYDWEKVGQEPNVVFPCGAVIRGNTIFVYYGGADSHVGVATIDLPYLLSTLTA